MVTADLNALVASLTVDASILLARPSLTGYAFWTEAMAAYARVYDPSCTSLTLSVYGLDIKISYKASIGKLTPVSHVWRWRQSWLADVSSACKLRSP